MRAGRCTSAASPSSIPARSTISSIGCARASSRAGRGRHRSFVYGMLRNDAVDVVYGTVEGFARLGIPYMPHILPQRSW